MAAELGVTQYPVLRELLQLWHFLDTQPSILWEISGVYERLTKRHSCKVPSVRDKVYPASLLFVRCHIKLALRLQCIVGLNAKMLGQGVVHGIAYQNRSLEFRTPRPQLLAWKAFYTSETWKLEQTSIWNF